MTNKSKNGMNNELSGDEKEYESRMEQNWNDEDKQGIVDKRKKHRLLGENLMHKNMNNEYVKKENQKPW
jgi:hypothetical protein